MYGRGLKFLIYFLNGSDVNVVKVLWFVSSGGMIVVLVVTFSGSVWWFVIALCGEVR